MKTLARKTAFSARKTACESLLGSFAPRAPSDLRIVPVNSVPKKSSVAAFISVVKRAELLVHVIEKKMCLHFLQALDDLIRSQVEKLVHKSQYAVLVKMRQKIAELQTDLERWKVRAKELQQQATEATILQQNSRRRSVRTVRYQIVTENKINIIYKLYAVVYIALNIMSRCSSYI